jgi:hypothetical protein
MDGKNKKKSTDSQSVKKILNQLQNLMETEWFKTEVLKIRAELGIPAEGLAITQKDSETIGSTFYVPEKAGLAKGDETHQFIKKLNTLTKPLADRLIISSTFLREVIKCYICHNTLEIDQIARNTPYMEKTGLCVLEDRKLILQERFRGGADPFLFPDFIEDLIADAERYPVILKLHPDFGYRDFLSYLKINWKTIQQKLSQYEVHDEKSVKNSKVEINLRNKSIKDFIYDHRHLPLKLIATRMREELGIIKDQGDISKIRGNEKKRRESK